MTRRLWPLLFIVGFYLAVSDYFGTFNWGALAGLVGGYAIGQVIGEWLKRRRRG